jgi:hypothetical protein
MIEAPGNAARFASHLMRTGIASLFIIILLLILLPRIAALPTGWHWLALVITALTASSLSLYLCFEALLFRLLASFPDAAAGGAAVDDYLSRAGLRKPAAALRSLQDRMHGTKRIIWLQRLALLAFLITLVSMA